MSKDTVEGDQFCMNCESCGEHGGCTNKKAVQVWFTNQVNKCKYFKGQLEQVDWSKATPVGARPSTFSRNKRERGEI